MRKLTAIFAIFLITFSLFGQIKVTATQAEYFEEITASKLTPNKNGVYPVKITISDSKPTADSYEVLVSTSENGPFTTIINVSAKETSFLHISAESKPMTKYYYKVQALKADKIIYESNVASGWGALTPEFYFMTYNKIITYSHNKLVLMNKKKNLEKLGEETSNGDSSGTLNYKTSVKGLNGVVTMTYSNYSDNKDWLLNGEMITKANMSANGTMTGTIEISGMYPGKVFYENVVILDGKAGNGTYDVQPKGFSLNQLNYQITFKNIDDYL